MARGKVTDKAIASELVRVVQQVYNGPNREKLSVNYARQEVEENLGLEDEYLKQGDWKAKSKEIIHNTMRELENADDEPSQATPSPKKPAKAAPKKSNKASQKRGKKAAPASDAESEVGDATDVEDAPVPPAKKRRVAKETQKKTKMVSDDDDESLDASEGQIDEESSKPAGKRRSKPHMANDSGSELSDAPDGSMTSKPISEKEDTPKSAEDGESELSDVIDEPPKRKPKAKTKAKAKAPPKPEPTTADDSSSELSSLIDDPPPPKRKRKSGGKDTTTTTTTTTAPAKRAAKSASSSTTTADSPDEAQVKLLQSQLGKCGVRKVWGAEFKKHGADTPKAKIRHLRDMLAEVGMPGRFSEAKAREIKEMRELQADLQDVMQGEKSWGVGGDGRGARRRGAAGGGGKQRVKELREGSPEGSDEEGGRESQPGKSEGGSEEEGAKHAVRGKGMAKRRADLAFLEDESESE